MRLRALRYALLLSVVSGITFLLRAALPSVSTGNWVASGNLSAARSGACTVVLKDGRLLVSGGADANGALATADLFSNNGTWSTVASMSSARSHQSCAVLQDGRVLVAGGTTAGGGITNSAEIYDPNADSWTQAGLLNDARSGASTSVLRDGRVLFAGGQSSGSALNTLEVFDPASGTFSNAGIMTSPRQDHAAAVLSDGRVLIAGGSSDGTNVVATTEIYDPQSGTVSAGPVMSTPRARHSATTLLDGSVVVIGGSDGSNDLASAEVFDPAANNFTASSALATARSKHSAFLLPNNNEVLVVGGQSASTDLASAELYIPWQKAFQGTGAMATPRSDASGAALTAVDGYLLMAGGTALSSAELYAFPTVKTDAADYAPGSIVTITGSGWTPGETVTLTLVESPLIDTHPVMTAVADGNGNISNSQFSPDEHDVNIRFYLTAVGGQSGVQAQNTFTDATATNTTLVSSPSTSNVNQSVTLTATVRNGNVQGSGTLVTVGTVEFYDQTGITNPNCGGSTGIQLGNQTVTSGTATISFQFTSAGAHKLGACYNGTGGSIGTQNSQSPSITQTVNAVATTTTTVTSSANPSVFGQSVTFTATVTVNPPGTGNVPSGETVTFKDGANTLGTGSTNSSGVAILTASSLVVASHSITAVYAGDANFSTSTSAALSQVVNQASTTTTLASSANPSAFGQSVTFTATIAINLAGTGTIPSGETVTFKDGTNTLGTGSTNGSGVATFATSSLSVAGHSITAVYAGDITFQGSTSAPLSQTVNKSTVTATVTANNKGYDGTTAATQNTCTLTGVLAADAANVTCSASTLNFEDKNVGNNKTVNVSGITLSGSASGSYQLSSTTATATASITTAAITAALTASDKVYDGTDVEPNPSMSCSVTGVLAADAGNVSCVATSGTFNNKDVSSATTVTATVTISGTAAGNYTLGAAGTSVSSTSKTAFANITPRPISITPDSGQNKVYGTTPDPLLTFSVGGSLLASGDTNMNVFTGSLVRAVGENVGNYAISQGSLVSNTNYRITSFNETVTFAINQAPLSITPDGAKTKTYGDVFSAFTGQVVGLKFYDAVSPMYASTGAPATASVGSYNITVASYIFTTGMASNYTVTTNTAVNGLVVSQRSVTVTADAESKFYLAPDPALTFKITSGNLVNGNTFSGSLTRTTGELPGSYDILQGTLSLGSNYLLTYIGAKLTISYGACSTAVGLGGVILPPINVDGSSVYQRKGGSTIPVKFRVCDYLGRSIGDPSVVFAGTGGTLTMLSAVRGTIDNINEVAGTDIPDAAFRWDSSGQQWIFNMATSNLVSGSTYQFRINLANSSQSIAFVVGVK
jgi:hypothetical protein